MPLKWHGLGSGVFWGGERICSCWQPLHGVQPAPPRGTQPASPWASCLGRRQATVMGELVRCPCWDLAHYLLCLPAASTLKAEAAQPEMESVPMLWHSKMGPLWSCQHSVCCRTSLHLPAGQVCPFHVCWAWPEVCAWKREPVENSGRRWRKTYILYMDLPI